MGRTSAFVFSVKNIWFSVALLSLLAVASAPVKSVAQVNVGLTAVASHTSGGLTSFGYGPDNYNDNVIVAFSSCGGIGSCPTPWGWVTNGQTIIYTWSSPVTFNKIVFFKADRPMNACNIQYWNGSSFVPLASYSSTICPLDSVVFTPVTTTILQFVNCVAPLINPNFREIQVWQSGPPPPTITGSTTYCTGDMITLTASSGATSPTFTWTGPSSFSATTASISVVASPATAGVYSCTVTSGGFTSTPRLDTITVVPPPTITLGTVPDVCQGAAFGALPYTATTSGATNYSIAYDPASLTAGFTDVSSVPLPSSPITLIVPSGAAAGTYTGTITVNNGICSGPGVPFSITVNPAPAPITGASNICTGSTITLSDATAGGLWSSGSTGIATVGSASGVVTGVTVGSAVMSYTLSSTGCYTTVLVNVVGISGPHEVCNGDSVALTATSTGGTWSSGDVALATVSSTGVVNGVAMGVVHISYTLGSGCVASWVMTVNPLAPIVGRDSVCLGSTRWLTNIVGGGVWTSSVPAVATILPDSGKVTGLLAGITNITYTLPTGCMSWTRFTVINYPNSITGTKKACPGTTTTLFNTPGGGVWTSSNPGIATVNPGTGVVTGVYADTVDIIYTIQPGCAVQTRVTINPLPAPITGVNVMCPNTNDSMHDVTPDGRWSSSTTPIVTIVDTTGVITAVSQGTGTIRYTLPTGCYRTKTVSVDALPIPDIIYNFTTGTFMATPGYVSYQWYDSIQGEIPGAVAPTLAALNTEYYYVIVTDSNGCTGKSPLYHFDIHQLGVTTVNNDKTRIYPNPASTTLNIESVVGVRAVVSGIDGRTVIDEANAKVLNISKLSSGVYVITLFDDQGVRLSVQKFTKE